MLILRKIVIRKGYKSKRAVSFMLILKHDFTKKKDTDD